MASRNYERQQQSARSGRSTALPRLWTIAVLACRWPGAQIRKEAMGRKLADTELELYRRVDEVLYYVWDPIGVATSPAARDEHQGYLPKVFTMLQEGMDASANAAYLDDVATDRMGLDANLEHSKRVAELLLDWKTEIYTIRRRQT
ncbi:hypothetical protein [Paraburkholderia sp. BR10872]